MIKLIAPQFFDKEISVQEHYHSEICDALYEGRDEIFCHFEGDRHAYLPLSLIQALDLDKLEIEEASLKSMEITDETVFE